MTQELGSSSSRNPREWVKVDLTSEDGKVEIPFATIPIEFSDQDGLDRLRDNATMVLDSLFRVKNKSDNLANSCRGGGFEDGNTTISVSELNDEGCFTVGRRLEYDLGFMCIGSDHVLVIGPESASEVAFDRRSLSIDDGEMLIAEGAPLGVDAWTNILKGTAEKVFLEKRGKIDNHFGVERSQRMILGMLDL